MPDNGGFLAWRARACSYTYIFQTYVVEQEINTIAPTTPPRTLMISEKAFQLPASVAAGNVRKKASMLAQYKEEKIFSDKPENQKNGKDP